MGKPYHIRIYYNAECLKCKKIEKEMLITGALVFCNKCMFEEFSSDYPAVKERKTYLKWLRKRNEEEE